MRQISMSAGIRSLQSEVRAFCAEWSLTPRETDIVLVLATGAVRIREIASQLGVSPNTVNNHVNSVFVKTKTRSKSELMACLLRRLSDRLFWMRLMSRASRVLVFSTAGRPGLADQLEERCFKVHFASNQLQEALLAFVPEFVLYFLDGSKEFSAVVESVRIGSRADVIFVKEHADTDEYCAMNDCGALGCVSAAEIEDLALIMIANHVEDDSDFRRLLGAQCEGRLRRGRSVIVPNDEHWGRGGVFLQSLDLQRAFGADLQNGDWVEFELRRHQQGDVILARGHVSWVRSEPRNALPAGAGIRLIGLNQGIRENLNSRACFIPAGLTTTAVT